MLLPWITSANKRYSPAAGGGSPAFGGEIQRDQVIGDLVGTSGREDHLLSAGIPAGSLAVVCFVNGSNVPLSGVTDSKSNLWTVRQTATDGYSYAAIATGTITTPLVAGVDTIYLATSIAYAERISSISYITNATYDTSATAAPYASAVSVPAATAAGVVVGVLSSSDGSWTQTYSGGDWTNIGSVTSYGFSRRAYFVYKSVTAGTQNPGGSWSGAVQQCNVWASGK